MPNRKLPPNKDLVKLYDSGMSPGEIGEKLGFNSNTVSSLLRRIGIRMRSPKEAAKLRGERGRHKVSRYWLGKKQPPEMVEKRVAQIRGEKHYLWKGEEADRDNREYRRITKKERCEKCGARLNLGIHHKNFDHYDNAPENLQVLCVSCHSSLHKKAYWDAIHAGKEPPRSNGPVGWRH